jgi:hypothetical protein
MYIHGLQSVTEDERSNVPWVTENKRQLKTAHRSLEKLHAERCCGLGDEIEALVRDATRHAWRAYRSVGKLEERLRGLKIGDSPGIYARANGSVQVRRRSCTRTDDEKLEIYVVTGAGKTIERSHAPLGMRLQYALSGHAEETSVTSGARTREYLPVEVPVPRAGRVDALNGPRCPPNALARKCPGRPRVA